MGSRAERRIRAEQKIQKLKKELLKVFMDGVDKKDYSYEKTMRNMNMAIRLVMRRNPQEAHLVRTAFIRLASDINEGVERYEKIKSGVMKKMFNRGQNSNE